MQSITVEDLDEYLGLIVSLFRHSPKGAHASFSSLVQSFICAGILCAYVLVVFAWVHNLGEFSTVAFQEVFLSLDATVNHRLSQGKTQKDRMRWASDVLSMHEVFLCDFSVVDYFTTAAIEACRV